MKENPMRQIKLERVVLSCSGVESNLEKSKKLLEFITEKKAQVNISNKRIPAWGVRPGLKVGTAVTLRGKSALEILKRMFVAIDNTIKEKQIADNHFSFGIKEYIEIPGIEYQREIGIRGLNVSAVFVRPGWRVKRKKIKAGKLPKKQNISKQEIITFLKENLNVRARK